ncbi:MAG: AAA family ATPase [Alphaproteobacteria bacterium]
MKIQSIQLKGFKRFTDLTIRNIPVTTKLVIIAGPNGCGKSSLFDGMNTWHKLWKGQGNHWKSEYHAKSSAFNFSRIDQAVKVSFHGTEPTDQEERKKGLYVRTAYRNDPQFRLDSLSRTGSQLDENRFNFLMENDAAVSRNYQRLASQAFKDAFVDYDGNATIAEFRQHVVGDIRDSMRRVFPDLILNDLGDPLEDGTFFFNKGSSHGFDYKNLSGGEKAAFDLILDLVVKSKDFDNTIFCIDEPELHMNTRLQGSLLQEMYDLISDESQLWISTHSIGMMRKAKEIAEANPDKVVFLDFDNLDFDQTQMIEPIKPNRAFWESVLHVALDDLATLVTPKRIVICEGVPYGTGTVLNEAHDAECLNKIFADEYPDTKFLAGGNCHDVASDKHALIGAISALASGAEVIRMIDRDDRSSDDIRDLKAQGIKVLSRRHLESFLFDDEVLDALCESVSQPQKKQEVKDAKMLAIQDSIGRGNPPDDIKRASGQVYTSVKRILGLTSMGNDPRSFMRSTLYL